MISEVSGFPTIVMVWTAVLGSAIGKFFKREIVRPVFQLRRQIELPLERANRDLLQQIKSHIEIERHIRSGETQLREAQQLAHVGSWEWDIIGNRVCWSNELFRIYGLEPQQMEISYGIFLNHVHPEDREKVHHIISSALAEKQPFEFEHRIVRPGGTVRILHSRGRVVLDQAGTAITMYGTGQDITEPRLAQEALRKARDELEIRVQERTEQLARANVVLKEEIAERTRAEERLRQSLQDKEILLKEIRHRVKNNLRIISSLFTFHTLYAKDDEAKEMLRESHNRIKSMGLIHDQLYRSTDLRRIAIREYLETLARNIFRSFGIEDDRVTLLMDVEDIVLGIDTAIPCGLLVNELVTNSLKHAFPDGRRGTISIHFHKAEGDRLTLSIKDDGVGFDKSKPSGEIDLEHPKSLGMYLVHTFIENLHATFDIRNHQGTAFIITFRELWYDDSRWNVPR